MKRHANQQHVLIVTHDLENGESLIFMTRAMSSIFDRINAHNSSAEKRIFEISVVIIKHITQFHTCLLETNNTSVRENVVKSPETSISHCA